MRKSTVRSGMRMLLAAMLLILLASLYSSITLGTTRNLYGQVIFWASALGGLGVIMAVAGLIRSPGRYDQKIKIYPLLLLIFAVIVFYFYLMASSFSTPAIYERLHPGETITI